MSSGQNKAIWVIDAGMMEAGGHHAALAETLCQAKARQPDTEINVFAHQQLDKQLQSRFEACDVAVEPFFTGLFYKYFHDGPQLGPAGLQQYICQLTLEYQGVLESALEQAKHQGIVVFFPCLNWEHGNALGFAISKLCLELADSNVHLVACAMYSPNPTSQQPETKPLWYKMAFKALIKHKFVSLYFSEGELCAVYSDLLSFDDCFTHPCYLMDWAGIATHNQTEQDAADSSKRYLLYMGDAKEDKGFNRLPQVLQQGLASTDADTQFVIQFTLAWEYPEIMATVEKLIDWAKSEARLILHQGFWTNQDVVKMISKIDGAVCTYDVEAYQQKNSGLVWMLAFFSKPLLIGGSCWLSREAECLNVPVSIDKALDVKQFSHVINTIKTTDNSYADRLFRPLLDWLVSH